MNLKVKQRFSTVVVVNGSNVPVNGVPGESIEGDSEFLDAVLRDVGDEYVVFVVAEAPKPGPVKGVKMAKPAVKAGRTRGVVETATAEDADEADG